jgi:hypothetical protein
MAGGLLGTNKVEKVSNMTVAGSRFFFNNFSHMKTPLISIYDLRKILPLQFVL